jgi:hypothetical protein
MRGGTSEVVKLIWVFREAIYFCVKGWTGFCDDCPSGKSVDKKQCVGWVEPFAKPIIFANRN